ncbi:hypothetical protein P4424_004050 [Escherichia coli]|nr:hypothetical protein [Escherichia coli]HAW7508121.1 hypothetical protein [Escherichia coli]
MTHFSGEPLAAHTNDRRLTMVDLFCCTGAIARQVPAAGPEVLSRVNASGREVLTRVLVAGNSHDREEALKRARTSKTVEALMCNVSPIQRLVSFLVTGSFKPSGLFPPALQK